MKKNVLFLINGYAIEQKGSYSLYNENLAPNFDLYVKHNFFTKLTTNALNYIDGYREFSIGSKGSLNYTFIKNEAMSGALDNNSELLGLKSKINNPDSKLHVLFFADLESNVDVLRDFFESMKKLNTKEIFVHLICTSDSMKGYKDLKGILAKFGYGYVPGVRVASVVGSSYIDDEATDQDVDDYVISLFYGYSELWRESDQKISNLMASNTLPNKIKTFCVNSRYEIANNDNILLFNYDKLAYTKLMDRLVNIPEKIRRRYENVNYNVYSLFPTGYPKIPAAFKERTSDICVDNYLKKIYSKAAIVDEKSRLNAINHCCAGLKNVLCENIDYYDSSNGILYNLTLLSEVINNSKYGLVILNYNIDVFNNIQDIRNEFQKIDEMLSHIYRLCKDRQYTLLVSSLYGIKRKMLDAYGNEIFLNLSERVPLIIIDDELNKMKKKISIYPFGEIYDLSKTIYKNINRSYQIDSLIREKQSIFSLIFKKKK